MLVSPSVKDCPYVSMYGWVRVIMSATLFGSPIPRLSRLTLWISNAPAMPVGASHIT